jgi:hypothetical protein
MEGWELAVAVAGLSGAELGIDPRFLGGGGETEALPPEMRAAFIQERRVAEFRRRSRG